MSARSEHPPLACLLLISTLSLQAKSFHGTYQDPTLYVQVLTLVEAMRRELRAPQHVRGSSSFLWHQTMLALCRLRCRLQQRERSHDTISNR